MAAAAYRDVRNSRWRRGGELAGGELGGWRLDVVRGKHRMIAAVAARDRRERAVGWGGRGGGGGGQEAGRTGGEAAGTWH